METIYQNLLVELTGEYISPNTCKQIYGQNFEQTLPSIERYISQFSTTKKLYFSGLINRASIEVYLDKYKLVPVVTAAARNGMTLQSYLETLLFLKEQGDPNLISFNENTVFVNEDYSKKLYSFLPTGKSISIFSDHNSSCRYLHKTLRKLGLHPKATYCETSIILKKDEPDFSFDLDIFTRKPIGLRYKVDLGLNKPIFALPDACSWNFYIRNEDVLIGFVLFEVTPKIPLATKAILTFHND